MRHIIIFYMAAACLMLSGCDRISTEIEKGLQETAVPLSPQDKAEVIGELLQEFDTTALELPSASSQAEIRPDGVLVIKKQALSATPEQKELLLQYRKEMRIYIEEVARATMEGPHVYKSMASSLTNLLNGQFKQADQDFDQLATHVSASMRHACSLMDPLLSTQQKIAESIPECSPYAISKKDAHACRQGVTASASAPIKP